MQRSAGRWGKTFLSGMARIKAEGAGGPMKLVSVVIQVLALLGCGLARSSKSGDYVLSEHGRKLFKNVEIETSNGVFELPGLVRADVADYLLVLFAKRIRLSVVERGFDGPDNVLYDVTLPVKLHHAKHSTMISQRLGEYIRRNGGEGRHMVLEREFSEDTRTFVYRVRTYRSRQDTRWERELVVTLSRKFVL